MAQMAAYDTDNGSQGKVNKEDYLVMYANQPYKMGTQQKKKEVYKARLDEAKSIYKSKPTIKLNTKDSIKGDLENGIIYSSQELGRS